MSIHSFPIGIAIGLAAGEVVALAPAFQTIQPFMEPIATFAQRELYAIIRSGDEAVQ
jgi:hypothetical protein